MQIREIYNLFREELARLYDSGEAEAITRIVFDSVDIDKSILIKDAGKVCDPGIEKKLKKFLDQLLNHAPVQYVVREAWFYNMRFFVNPSVLIPRPETEELVKKVIEHVPVTGTKSVLDIGTGSGCIAISIKKNCSNTVLTALDVSEEAIRVAHKNAVIHDTPVEFLQLDFSDEQSWNNFPVFDLIVSNPPYIPFEENTGLEKNVLDFEPHLALFAPGGKPLYFYDKIARFGKQHLAPGGTIFLEIHEGYGDDVKELFESSGYSATIEKDVFGKQRIAVVTHSR